MRARSAALLVTLLLAVAGGGTAWYALHTTPTESAAPPVVRKVPVEVTQPRIGRAAQLIHASGTLQSVESVTVQSEIAGRIVRLGFEQGERVEAGTVLVELDPTTLRAELEQAEAMLAVARQNHDRAQQLARQGAGTARALDEATAQLRTATAAVDLSRARLEKASIRAPFAGTLGLRNISVGRYVNPGETLIRLENLDRLNIDFRISERYLNRLATGQPVTVRVDAVPDRLFEAEIVAVDPVVDVNGRAAMVRAVLDNPERLLRPGLFARVTVEIAAREDAVLVPEAALVPRQAGPIVYVVEDGRALERPVATGVRRDGEVEVTQGLEAESVVVVAGQLRLRDGANVDIVSGPGGS
ncbi:MAG TPA: efflux RND transporter periplasmic adaptor subunit [Geminicoccaceae bacterium]|nr:efflux RND transporter periplasmic adaptor subunit [Geminicoccaceae bacterium]